MVFFRASSHSPDEIFESLCCTGMDGNTLRRIYIYIYVYILESLKYLSEIVEYLLRNELTEDEVFRRCLFLFFFDFFLCLAILNFQFKIFLYS